VDKLIVEALEVTLRHLLTENWHAVPTLRMIFADSAEMRERAERILRRLEYLDASVRESTSAIGGGSTPGQTLPTWVIELNVPNPTALERHLRSGQVPVIARIERDKIILDMRTIGNEEEELLAAAVQSAAKAARNQIATLVGPPRS
jgi:L-seryl-tRNA(Ser) seleniumtransferase